MDFLGKETVLTNMDLNKKCDHFDQKVAFWEQRKSLTSFIFLLVKTGTKSVVSV